MCPARLRLYQAPVTLLSSFPAVSCAPCLRMTRHRLPAFGLRRPSCDVRSRAHAIGGSTTWEHPATDLLTISRLCGSPETNEHTAARQSKDY